MTGEGAAPGRVPAERTHRPRRIALVAALAVLGLLLLLALPVARIAFVEPFEIAGSSMVPALYPRERVLLDKSAFGLFLPLASRESTSWAMPRLGDVVIYHSPRYRADVVTRVIGLPGDRIASRATSVERNGVPLKHDQVACPTHSSAGAENPTCFQETLAARSYMVAYDGDTPASAELRVPANHLYVLGDNRSASNDSRNPAIGAIDRAQLKGRVTRIYGSPHPGRFWHAVQ